MQVTPFISDRSNDTVIFRHRGFPVFFQRHRKMPEPGVEINCMITKCFYARFQSGALNYGKLRFMLASVLDDKEQSPRPLLVKHSGFQYKSPEQEVPVAEVSEDYFVNDILVLAKGDPIIGTEDLLASPRSCLHPVPGQVYVRKKDGVIRFVGAEDASAFSYFYGRDSYV